MKLDTVLELLKEKNAEMESRFCVKSLQLFGSVARDEARSSSDVDLLVEFNRSVGYFGLFALQNYLDDCSAALLTWGLPTV